MSKFISEEFIGIVTPIMNHELYKSMTQYNHHGIIDTHFHSVHVSYYVFGFCNKFHFDYKKTLLITQASLLHDFYLYNWYTDKHNEYHAFYHPKEAVKNIEKYSVIDLNDMQREMILRHMFPLGKIPVSIGGWILTICDKICAGEELVKKGSGFKETYNLIVRKVQDND